MGTLSVVIHTFVGCAHSVLKSDKGNFKSLDVLSIKIVGKNLNLGRSVVNIDKVFLFKTAATAARAAK